MYIGGAFIAGVENPVRNLAGGKNLKSGNYYKMEIDVTPNDSVATWARVGAGITSLESSMNEVLDQTSTLDGDGWGQTSVIGGQITWELSGERVYGDKAQDFIFERSKEFGFNRITNFRATAPNGDITQGNVSIVNILGPGGEVGGKSGISFEIHFNGKPEFLKAEEE